MIFFHVGLSGWMTSRCATGRRDSAPRTLSECMNTCMPESVDGLLSIVSLEPVPTIFHLKDFDGTQRLTAAEHVGRREYFVERPMLSSAGRVSCTLIRSLDATSDPLFWRRRNCAIAALSSDDCGAFSVPCPAEQSQASPARA